MIYDMRTYTVHPGKTREYLEIYERDALPVQLEHLGNLIGYFTSEVGPLNKIVHIWAYESWTDRETRREQMWSDPRFNEAAKKLYPLIQAQEDVILKGTPFSPLR